MACSPIPGHVQRTFDPFSRYRAASIARKKTTISLSLSLSPGWGGLIDSSTVNMIFILSAGLHPIDSACQEGQEDMLPTGASLLQLSIRILRKAGSHVVW